jgi:hypothetical protein
MLGHSLRCAQCSSIDRFLELREDDRYLAIGKAVIAALLIPFEDEDVLLAFDVNPVRRWYHYVLDRLAGKRGEFDSNRLAVLTFNYDRSFEMFMSITLQSRYGIGSDEAENWMKAVPVIHLHGQLGALGGTNDDAGSRPYHPNVSPLGIKIAARGIHIVHEAIAENPEFTKAKALLREAEEIWFLGFGYLPANVERLGSESFVTAGGRRGPLRLMGTAYTATGMERSSIQRTVSPRSDPQLILGGANEDILRFLRERWSDS